MSERARRTSLALQTLQDILQDSSSDESDIDVRWNGHQSSPPTADKNEDATPSVAPSGSTPSTATTGGSGGQTVTNTFLAEAPAVSKPKPPVQRSQGAGRRMSYAQKILQELQDASSSEDSDEPFDSILNVGKLKPVPQSVTKPSKDQPPRLMPVTSLGLLDASDSEPSDDDIVPQVEELLRRRELRDAERKRQAQAAAQQTQDQAPRQTQDQAQPAQRSSPSLVSVGASGQTGGKSSTTAPHKSVDGGAPTAPQPASHHQSSGSTAGSAASDEGVSDTPAATIPSASSPSQPVSEAAAGQVHGAAAKPVRPRRESLAAIFQRVVRADSSSEASDSSVEAPAGARPATDSSVPPAAAEDGSVGGSVRGPELPSVTDGKPSQVDQENVPSTTATSVPAPTTTTSAPPSTSSSATPSDASATPSDASASPTRTITSTADTITTATSAQSAAPGDTRTSGLPPVAVPASKPVSTTALSPTELPPAEEEGSRVPVPGLRATSVSPQPPTAVRDAAAGADGDAETPTVLAPHCPSPTQQLAVYSDPDFSLLPATPALEAGLDGAPVSPSGSGALAVQPGVVTEFARASARSRRMSSLNRGSGVAAAAAAITTTHWDPALLRQLKAQSLLSCHRQQRSARQECLFTLSQPLLQRRQAYSVFDRPVAMADGSTRFPGASAVLAGRKHAGHHSLPHMLVVDVDVMQDVSGALTQHRQQRQHGLPTCIHNHRRYVCVGTSRGLVLLFDHFQKPIGVCGSLKEFPNRGAVTCVAAHPAHDRTLAVGYESGTVVLWDAHKQSELRVIKDMVGSPIAFVSFTAPYSADSVVAADQQGNVLVFRITKGYIRYSHETLTVRLAHLSPSTPSAREANGGSVGGGREGERTARGKHKCRRIYSVASLTPNAKHPHSVDRLHAMALCAEDWVAVVGILERTVMLAQINALGHPAEYQLVHQDAEAGRGGRSTEAKRDGGAGEQVADPSTSATTTISTSTTTTTTTSTTTTQRVLAVPCVSWRAMQTRDRNYNLLDRVRMSPEQVAEFVLPADQAKLRRERWQGAAHQTAEEKQEDGDAAASQKDRSPSGSKALGSSPPGIVDFSSPQQPHTAPADPASHQSLSVAERDQLAYQRHRQMFSAVAASFRDRLVCEQLVTEHPTLVVARGRCLRIFLLSRNTVFVPPLDEQPTIAGSDAPEGPAGAHPAQSPAGPSAPQDASTPSGYKRRHEAGRFATTELRTLVLDCAVASNEQGVERMHWFLSVVPESERVRCAAQAPATGPVPSDLTLHPAGSIVAVEWLGGQVLAVLTARLGHLTVFAVDPFNARVLQTGPLKSFRLTAPTVPRFVDPGVSPRTLPTAAYANAVGCDRSDTITMLCGERVLVAVLAGWDDRVQYARAAARSELQRHPSRRLWHLSMALQFVGGVADVATHLPRDPKVLRGLLGEKLRKMVLAYVRSALVGPTGDQPRSHQNQKAQPAATGVSAAVVHLTAAAAVEFCTQIQAQELLTGDIYRAFAVVKEADVQVEGVAAENGYRYQRGKLPHGQGIFLEVLEPYILSNRIRSLPPNMFSDFLRWYALIGRVRQAEACVSHLNFSCLVQPLVERSRASAMGATLMSMYPLGVGEYHTPIDEILRALFRPYTVSGVTQKVLEMGRWLSPHVWTGGDAALFRLQTADPCACSGAEGGGAALVPAFPNHPPPGVPAGSFSPTGDATRVYHVLSSLVIYLQCGLSGISFHSLCTFKDPSLVAAVQCQLLSLLFQPRLSILTDDARVHAHEARTFPIPAVVLRYEAKVRHTQLHDKQTLAAQERGGSGAVGERKIHSAFPSPAGREQGKRVAQWESGYDSASWDLERSPNADNIKDYLTRLDDYDRYLNRSAYPYLSFYLNIMCLPTLRLLLSVLLDNRWTQLVAEGPDQPSSSSGGDRSAAQNPPGSAAEQKIGPGLLPSVEQAWPSLTAPQTSKAPRNKTPGAARPSVMRPDMTPEEAAFYDSSQSGSAQDGASFPLTGEQARALGPRSYSAHGEGPVRTVAQASEDMHVAVGAFNGVLARSSSGAAGALGAEGGPDGGIYGGDLNSYATPLRVLLRAVPDKSRLFAVVDRLMRNGGVMRGEGGAESSGIAAAPRLYPRDKPVFSLHYRPTRVRQMWFWRFAGQVLRFRQVIGLSLPDDYGQLVLRHLVQQVRSCHLALGRYAAVFSHAERALGLGEHSASPAVPDTHTHDTPSPRLGLEGEDLLGGYPPVVWLQYRARLCVEVLSLEALVMSVLRKNPALTQKPGQWNFVYSLTKKARMFRVSVLLLYGKRRYCETFDAYLSAIMALQGMRRFSQPPQHGLAAGVHEPADAVVLGGPAGAAGSPVGTTSSSPQYAVSARQRRALRRASSTPLQMDPGSPLGSPLAPAGSLPGAGAGPGDSAGWHSPALQALTQPRALSDEFFGFIDRLLSRQGGIGLQSGAGERAGSPQGMRALDASTVLRFRKHIMARLPRLLRTDPGHVANLIITHFPNDRDSVVQALRTHPQLQFEYLRAVAERPRAVPGAPEPAGDGATAGEEGRAVGVVKPGDGRTPAPAQLSMFTPALHETYVDLLCRFAPQNVYRHLEQYDGYDIPRMRALVTRYGLRDALCLLLERTGDQDEALQLVMKALGTDVERLFGYVYHEWRYVREAHLAWYRSQTPHLMSQVAALPSVRRLSQPNLRDPPLVTRWSDLMPEDFMLLRMGRQRKGLSVSVGSSGTNATPARDESSMARGAGGGRGSPSGAPPARLQQHLPELRPLSDKLCVPLPVSYAQVTGAAAASGLPSEQTEDGVGFAASNDMGEGWKAVQHTEPFAYLDSSVSPADHDLFCDADQDLELPCFFSRLFLRFWRKEMRERTGCHYIHLNSRGDTGRSPAADVATSAGAEGGSAKPNKGAGAGPGPAVERKDPAAPSPPSRPPPASAVVDQETVANKVMSAVPGVPYSAIMPVNLFVLSAVGVITRRPDFNSNMRRTNRMSLVVVDRIVDLVMRYQKLQSAALSTLSRTVAALVRRQKRQRAGKRGAWGPLRLLNQVTVLPCFRLAFSVSVVCAVLQDVLQEALMHLKEIVPDSNVVLRHITAQYGHCQFSLFRQSLRSILESFVYEQNSLQSVNALLQLDVFSDVAHVYNRASGAMMMAGLTCGLCLDPLNAPPLWEQAAREDQPDQLARWLPGGRSSAGSYVLDCGHCFHQDCVTRLVASVQRHPALGDRLPLRRCPVCAGDGGLGRFLLQEPFLPGAVDGEIGGLVFPPDRMQAESKVRRAADVVSRRQRESCTLYTNRAVAGCDPHVLTQAVTRTAGGKRGGAVGRADVAEGGGGSAPVASGVNRRLAMLTALRAAADRSAKSTGNTLLTRSKQVEVQYPYAPLVQGKSLGVPPGGFVAEEHGAPTAPQGSKRTSRARAAALRRLTDSSFATGALQPSLGEFQRSVRQKAAAVAVLNLEPDSVVEPEDEGVGGFTKRIHVNLCIPLIEKRRYKRAHRLRRQPAGQQPESKQEQPQLVLFS